MNYGKRIALFRPPSSRSVESESVLSVDDYEDGDEKDHVKRKTRNLSEKKRRDQFNLLINELCSMVAAKNKKMDKSTVLKSAIQFLRTHQEISVQSAANEIREDWKPTFLCNEEFAQLMLEAMDSLLIVFTQQGSVLFVSESVTSLLGHLPSDLIGRSLYDFVHEDDHVKLYNVLSTYLMQSNSFGPDFERPENQINLTCHFRRGTIDPKDLSTYEFVQICGSSRYLANEDDLLMEDMSNDLIGLQSPNMSVCFCCTVRLQTSHIIREMSSVDEATCEFTSRHSLEWKFLFLDHRAPPIIGYLPFEVLGTSGYDYYHPEDIERVSKCHEQLVQMGEGTSCYYRFLTKGQQWIWLRTRYFITYHQWNSKPEFIVCTNTVVRYADVRSELRKELGYMEDESFGNKTSAESGKGDKSYRSPSLCSVSSGGQSSTCPMSPRPSGRHSVSSSVSSKSPDHVSSVSNQVCDVDSSQHQHPCEEPGQKRKYVTTQLQSLLQQHLQRNTALRNMQQQQQQQQQLQHSQHPLQAVAATATTVPPHLMPSIVPIMAMPPNMIAMPPATQLITQVMSPVSGIASPIFSPSQALQAVSPQQGVYLTPAQQLLHDQLLQKSEQLQDTIRRQQEELRMITQQLSQTQSRPSPGQQQQQCPVQQQHAGIMALQNHIPVSSTPVLLTNNSSITAALNIMCSGGSQIMFSPVHMDPMTGAATSQHSSMPFQIISPDTDLTFCSNDLSDSC